MNEKKDAKEPNRNKDSAELGGSPTTAGQAPGGPATGLHHQGDVTGLTTGAAGSAMGGARPTGAGGGSGDSAGGLAEGVGNIGGTRNLTHGAGRPGTRTSEGLPPQGLDSPLDVDKQQIPNNAGGTPPTLAPETAARQGD